MLEQAARTVSLLTNLGRLNEETNSMIKYLITETFHDYVLIL
jgi:hypothetical protein